MYYKRTKQIIEQNKKIEIQKETFQEIQDELQKLEVEYKSINEIFTIPKNIQVVPLELPQSFDEKFLEKVINYIITNINQTTLSVEELSQASNYSKVQFYRKIKEITGLTPIDLIKTIRLKEAEKMLITGKYSVTDVAYNVGFSDPRYFSKCFKELYNVTPSDFIKKYLDISS